MTMSRFIRSHLFTIGGNLHHNRREIADVCKREHEKPHIPFKYRLVVNDGNDIYFSSLHSSDARVFTIYIFALFMVSFPSESSIKASQIKI